MRRPIIACAFAAGLLLSAMPARAQDAAPGNKDVTGLWLVKKKDVVVEIKPCARDAETLCGHIAWLDPNAKLQVDALNPDARLRDRPLCGIRVMWDMRADAAEAGVYDGEIYKANNGTTYSARIHRNAEGKLELRGYLGVPLFGKTAFLTPVAEGSYPLCIQRKARARKP